MAQQPSVRPRMLLRADGQLNVGRPEGRRFMLDLNHKLLRLSWGSFFAVYAGIFLLINAVFGTAFALLGPGSLDGLPARSGLDYLLDCFFFSVQTFGTIGYGHVSPLSHTANAVVTLESLVSFFFVAIGTGLVFARFGRPTARVLFSRVAVLNTQDGQPVFRFRIANERFNHVNEAKVKLVLIRTVRTKEGETFRRQFDLPLMRDETPLFALTWTVVHPVDEKSPFYGLSDADLREADAQVMVHFRGVDETLSQTIYARHVYSVDAILRDRVFVDVVREDRRGRLIVDLRHLHHTADYSPLKEGTP